LGAQAAHPQPGKMVGVVGAVDDPQVFAATTLYGRLTQSFLAPNDEVERLDDHAFATVSGQTFPPGDSLLLADWIGYINHLEVGRQEHLWIMLANAGQCFHVPDVVLMCVDLAFGCQEVERRELQIVQRMDRPAVFAVGSNKPLDILAASEKLRLDCRD